MNTRPSSHLLAALIIAASLLAGCMGRTGKIGTPIAERYKVQLAALKLGESSPEDLQKAFAKIKTPSLKEARIESGKKIEIWEVAHGGNMDAADFIMWGAVAYDKDQSILFRFEDGKLVSYESIVHPDPVSVPVQKNASPNDKLP
jgi:hypothetical protein